MSAFVRVVARDLGDVAEMWVRASDVSLVMATAAPDTSSLVLASGNSYFVAGSPSEIKGVIEGAETRLPGADHPSSHRMGEP